MLRYFQACSWQILIFVIGKYERFFVADFDWYVYRRLKLLQRGMIQCRLIDAGAELREIPSQTGVRISPAICLQSSASLYYTNLNARDRTLYCSLRLDGVQMVRSIKANAWCYGSVEACISL